MVLLPGIDGTGDLFAPLVTALGRDVRSIIVRYPDQPLDYASHEQIARAALPVGQPFIVLGESFSGPIAISIAASAPAGLRGYVLCCSFVRSPRRLLRWLRPLLGLLPARRVPDAVTAYFLMGRFAPRTWSGCTLRLFAESHRAPWRPALAPSPRLMQPVPCVG